MAPDPARLSFRRFAALFAVLFALAALPVLLCDTLPLFDYPNHLARMRILAGGSAELQRYYAVVWRPLPNLAMDLIVPPLAAVTPLAWAAKLFVLTTLLLLAGGAACLQRVICGSWSAWSCLAFLLLYSRTLLWGFLNYLFGVGLGLVLFALWLALARRSGPLRLAIGVVAALLLFFAHLLACGLYGVLVMGHALAAAWRHRAERRRAAGELVVAALPFVPPLLLLLLATPGSAGGAILYGNPWRKLDLLFSVFDNYHRPFDVACFVVAALALIPAFARRWVRLEPETAWSLGLLALVYLVMPSQLATASGADHRVPVLLFLVLVGASRWLGAGAHVQRLYLGGALVLFLLRMGAVAVSWQASDRLYAELLPALDAVPQGGRLAVAYPPEALNSEPTPLAHFPTLAIIRRDAFVPTLFAFPTQQPVALQSRYRALADRLPPERLWAAFMGGPPLDAEERKALGAYDNVVFVARNPFAPPVAAALVPVFAAPRFALFAVAPGY